MEQIPYERPDWVRAVNSRLEMVIDQLGEPFMLGTVELTYTGPDWTTGNGVFRGECVECHAYSTITTADISGLRWLAAAVNRYECPKKGHRVDLNGKTVTPTTP